MPGTSIIDSHWPWLPLLNIQLPAAETREGVDSIGSLFFSWKGQQFFLRNSHKFWVWVCLFLLEPLWGAYIMFNALETWSQSRDSTAKEMWGVGLWPLSHYIPCQPGAALLREWWHSLLKDPLRGSTLKGQPLLGFSTRDCCKLHSISLTPQGLTDHTAHWQAC